MAAMLSIKETYKRHRAESPTSTLSERAIRHAVKIGRLPSIMAGSKALICDEIFEKWLRGELNE